MRDVLQVALALIASLVNIFFPAQTDKMINVSASMFRKGELPLKMIRKRFIARIVIPVNVDRFLLPTDFARYVSLEDNLSGE